MLVEGEREADGDRDAVVRRKSNEQSEELEHVEWLQATRAEVR